MIQKMKLITAVVLVFITTLFISNAQQQQGNQCPSIPLPVDSFQNEMCLVESHATTPLFERMKEIPSVALAALHLHLPALQPIQHTLNCPLFNLTAFIPHNLALQSLISDIHDAYCETTGNREEESVTAVRLKTAQPCLQHLTISHPISPRSPSTLKTQVKSMLLDPAKVKMVGNLSDADCETMSLLRWSDAIVINVLADFQRKQMKPTVQDWRVIHNDCSPLYSKLRLNAVLEHMLTRSVSYHVATEALHTSCIKGKWLLPTLAAQPELAGLGSESLTSALVLQRLSDNTTQLLYGTPAAPVSSAILTEQNIDAVNGWINVIDVAYPVPSKLSTTLLLNQLFLTHAILNYTGLIDEFDSQRNMTFLSPTDSALQEMIHLLPFDHPLRNMIDWSHSRLIELSQLPYFIQPTAMTRRGHLLNQLKSRARASHKLNIDGMLADRVVASEQQHLRIDFSLHDNINIYLSSDHEWHSPLEVELHNLTETTLKSMMLGQAFNGTLYSTELKHRVSLLTQSDVSLGLGLKDGNITIGPATIEYSDVPVLSGVLHLVSNITTPLPMKLKC